MTEDLHSGLHLLADDPAESDSFGSHGRIADSVAALLRSGGPPLAIGLVGERGSGKSTVVRAVREKIESGGGWLVFCYDAWAHVGDHLHKAFLQEMVGALGGVVPCALRAEIDKTLEERVQLSHAVSRSHLTRWGAALSALALLVPAGAALVAAGGSSAWPPWIVRAALAACVAPFALAAVLLVLALAGRIKPSAEEGSGRLGAFARIFVSDSKPETFSKTTYSPEPGSVEFARLFARVVSSLGGRPLLIVLDNLDRLENRDAARAWSVMRTYTDALVASSGHKVWTLVPVSPAPTGAGWYVAGGEPGRPEAGPRDEGVWSKALQAFFRVPPPLPSDWRLYLRGLMAEAGLQWRDEADIGAAVSCLGAAQLGTKRPFTPREIKRFVNELVALADGARAGIPLASHATLAAIWAMEPEWRPPLAVPAQIASVGRASYRELAALYYRTDPEKAMQITFGARIGVALDRGDHGDVRALISECPEACGALEDVVAGTLAHGSPGGATDGPRLAHMATAVLGLPPGAPERRQCLALLVAHLREATGWGGLDPACAPGIAEIACCDDSGRDAEALLAKIAQALPPGGPPEGDTWIGGFLSAAAEIARRRPDLRLPKIGATPELYLSYAGALVLGRDATRVLLEPECGPAKVVETLSRANIGSEEWASLVGKCRAVGPKWDWRPVLQAVGTSLARDGQDTLPLLRVVLSLYSAFPVDAQAALLRAKQPGWLLHRIALAGLQPDTIIWALLADVNPDVQSGAQQQRTEQGRAAFQRWLRSPTETEKIGARVAELGLADNFAAAWDSAGPAKEALRLVLGAAARDSPGWPASASVAEAWSRFSGLLGEDFCVARVREDPLPARRWALGAGFSLALAPVYRVLLGSSPSGELLEVLGGGYAALGKDSWLKLLSAGGPALRLAVELAPTGGLGLSGDFAEALEAAAALATKGTRIAAGANEISALADCLGSDKLAFVRQQVALAICQKKGATTAALGVFAGMLAGLVPRPQVVDAVLSRALGLMAEKDWAGVALIASLVGVCLPRADADLRPLAAEVRAAAAGVGPDLPATFAVALERAQAADAS